jgi:hypothetical protein
MGRGNGGSLFLGKQQGHVAATAAGRYYSLLERSLVDAGRLA